MSHYLVTGGAGFIGSHLVQHLLSAGHQATVIDDLSSGKIENLAEFQGDVRFVSASVLDATALLDATKSVDGIFHLAARASVADSIERPLDCHAQNATGTLQVLEVARQRQCPVVYVGSSSAYGNDCDGPICETQREAPLSPYAVAKLCGELYCRSYHAVHGLRVAVVRFFNIFGPRQVANSPYSGVVAAFCHALLQGRRPTIHGDGGQTRDFTYVSDAVRGCVLAMQALASGDAEDCLTVNLATGESRSVLDLLRGLCKVAGVDIEPQTAAARAGDVRHSVADVAAARQHLGFSADVVFLDGLRRTYDWYRSLVL